MKPGTVVVVNFPGVTGTKRRPAVVISTPEYNSERPDIIVALITSQISKATAASDHILDNWASAGLDKPSAVRTFIQTYPASDARAIGILTDSDWALVRQRLRHSIEI
jgi:mRNA interferase MazF